MALIVLSLPTRSQWIRRTPCPHPQFCRTRFIAAQEATALSIATEGYHTLTYWSEDNAGNVETPHRVIVPIDLTPPVVQGTTNVAPNAKGWFRTDVTVQWSASDPPLIDGHPGSGGAEVSPPVTVTQEGKGIAPAAAVGLLRDAQYLLASWEERTSWTWRERQPPEAI
ncbi:MAG: hypothetical protein M0Z66_04810 [Thermaerobacter sp.]|nr:hypothetical protein [Thermaerobacter sp.]